MSSQMNCIQLSDGDNVAICLAENGFAACDSVVCAGITLNVTDAIPRGHKCALKPILKGDKVFKYGTVIAEATRDISAGAHVHIQNCAMPANGASGPAKSRKWINSSDAGLPTHFEG